MSVSFCFILSTNILFKILYNLKGKAEYYILPI